MGNDIESLLHTKWGCQYHIVFALKYKYGNRHFWCRGYYVDTVERNKTAITKYIIQNQIQEDQIAEQISMKEYIDLFKGNSQNLNFYIFFMINKLILCNIKGNFKKHCKIILNMT